MKTPDVLDQVDDLELEAKEKLEEWIKYGEYVTLEYDTEKDELICLKP